MPMSVVLPAPFGPSNAKKSPCSTSRSTPFSAWTPFLYVLVRLRTESAFIRVGWSVRKIAGDVFLVGALVAGFDGSLLRQRFLCLRGEFRQALLVGRIQAEKVVFVRLRHSQGQIEEGFPGFGELLHQACRRRQLDVGQLGGLHC